MTDTVSPTPAAAPERLLRIQEVAADTGLTPRAIRYYEELGLLAPAARSDGAYRLYDAEDLERLRFIRGLRDDAGFSLAEIGQLLEDEQARTRNRQTFRRLHLFALFGRQTLTEAGYSHRCLQGGFSVRGKLLCV